MKDGTAHKPKSRRAAIRELVHLYAKRDFVYFLLFALIASLTIINEFTVEHFVGGFLITAVIFAIYYRDILRYSPKYIKDYRTILLLGVIFAGTLLVDRVFHHLLTGLSKGVAYIPAGTAQYILPVAAGAMLVTLLFDFHTALLFSFAVSILSGLWLNDAVMMFYFFVSSLVASFKGLSCRKRSDILKAGFFVSAMNVLTVLVVLLFTGDLFTAKTAPSLALAVLSGAVVAMLVSIILPVLEHSFNKTTDISLLELLDLNHPLMRNLMISAPGTYHHSVIVGNLVEAAAEVVGVNPLLARVCAYYHDIGKMKMPEYFVENQAGSVSRHDKLSPHMSSMILISHVKEGLELARQYKLPPPILDNIEQHHGSNVITYFFQKARTELGENPSPEDYRYPGPKPQSRLAALVMMADAVEASSRVLKDPTPARIGSLVDKIVNHVFLDGQLDECELTLKDISTIKKHFTYILTGIFHRRIDYPGFDFNTDGAPAPQGSGDDGHDKKPAEGGAGRPDEAPGGRRPSAGTPRA